MKKNKVEKRMAESGNEVQGTTLSGYAAIFNSPTEIYDYIEVIEPGAFDGADMSDVRALVNHDSSKILGRTSSGTLRLSVDSRGLKYEIDLPETTVASDLKVSVSRSDITQSSFAFIVSESDWITKDGKDCRVIRSFSKILDVSPVTYPGYDDTTVSLRSYEEYKQATKEEDGQKVIERDSRLRDMELEMKK